MTPFLTKVRKLTVFSAKRITLDSNEFSVITTAPQVLYCRSSWNLLSKLGFRSKMMMTSRRRRPKYPWKKGSRGERWAYWSMRAWTRGWLRWSLINRKCSSSSLNFWLKKPERSNWCVIGKNICLKRTWWNKRTSLAKTNLTLSGYTVMIFAKGSENLPKRRGC